MKDWSRIRLGDSGTWVSGGTPSTSNAAYWGGSIPWMSSKSLIDFRVQDSERRLTKLGTESGTRLVPANAILMVVRGMSLKTEFRMGITQREVALSQDLKGLLPGPDLDPLFLAYAIKSKTSEILDLVDEAGHGTGRLQTDRLFALELVVPPLDDQRRIAATLGVFDEKIESNCRLLSLTDGLLQARWRDASRHAKRARRLSDVTSTQYGLTASADAAIRGPRFLRVTDINKANWVLWSSVPSVSITKDEWDKYRLRKGDLLVARMADPGKAAIYDDESVDAVFASYLVRLRAGSYAESLYVYGFLKSALYASYAEGARTGSVQKNMNAKVIVDVDLPWPPVSKVRAFAARAVPLRASMNHLVRENRQLSTLRDALLPELTCGRIRAPEISEEVNV